MQKNRILAAKRATTLAAILGLLLAGGARASAQTPDEDVEAWLETQAEQGQSHASGGQPELGPQLIGNPTRAVTRNRFARWQLRIPAATIKSRLTAGRFVLETGTTAGPVTGVEVVQRMAASGRIGVARVKLTTGSVLVKGWENLRRVLGTTAVSTTDCRGTTIAANFILNNPSVVEPFLNSDGTFGGVMAYGGGWGHNVGLSQFGAHGRGLAGQNFIQILEGYYTGIDVGSYPIDIGREPGGGPPTLRQEFFAPSRAIRLNVFLAARPAAQPVAGGLL